MKTFSLLALALVNTLVSAAPASPPAVPWDDPDFRSDAAEVALVVATIGPLVTFPAPVYPPDPNKVWVSLNQRFWFPARVASVPFGRLGGRGITDIEVVSFSHWASEITGRISGPALFPVLIHGPHRVMPKDAITALVAGPRGALFVPVLHPVVLRWLPCSVARLKEELDPAYLQHYEIRPGHPRHAEALRYPELFSSTEGGFVPRYGVAVTAIEQHLAGRQLTPADLACREAPAR
ncbi:MAG: hypothetical protein V4723_07535 [Pseudomonadota bacterium]